MAAFRFMSAAENKPEIRPLTGIRGFAAGLVLLNHFLPVWSTFLPPLRVLGPLADRGGLGVDLFFVLSGFILCHVYFDGSKSRLAPAAYRRFVWHRFVRLWPVHVATLGLLAALVLGARLLAVPLSGHYPFSALPFQLTMTHIWPGVPGPTDADPLNARVWNYPSWSISAEWFAYLLVFPAVWYLLKSLAGRGWLSLLLGCLAMAVWALGWGQIPGAFAVCQVAFEFVTGALFYNVWRAAPAVARGCQRLATPVFVLVVAALLFCPGDWPRLAGSIILLFPFLLLGLTAETAMIAKLFATRPAGWLGRISYSLYMTQAIPQKVLKLVLVPEHFAQSPLAVRATLAAATVLVLLGVASGCYYLIENPARHFLRARTDGHPPGPAN
jgi:peptidoglycan/LPS O-acetylase OafA/YrhL